MTQEAGSAFRADAPPEGEYRGDYQTIKRSLNGALDTLEDALAEVAGSADQVASAADKIAAGSQSLAEGSSEQASSLEEVSSSLQELSSMAGQNAGSAKEAAKETAALIQQTVEASEEGVEVQAEVTEKLGGIQTGVSRVREVMEEIAAASEQQTDGVGQINGAVEEMNAVTQRSAAKLGGERQFSRGAVQSGSADDRPGRSLPSVDCSERRPARSSQASGAAEPEHAGCGHLGSFGQGREHRQRSQRWRIRHQPRRSCSDPGRGGGR